jgi:hypothetical protein
MKPPPSQRMILPPRGYRCSRSSAHSIVPVSLSSLANSKIGLRLDGMDDNADIAMLSKTVLFSGVEPPVRQ